MQAAAYATNKAQAHLNFEALEKGSKILEPPVKVVEAFKQKSHDDAVREVNKLAERQICIPLSFSPILLTKFGTKRLGTIEEAEQVFTLVIKQHNIDPATSKSSFVDALFAELMWVYIKRKERQEARIEELATKRPCTRTLTALSAFYEKNGAAQKTIDLHYSWPENFLRDGSSLRYAAYAMKNLNREFQERKAIYEEALKKNPELMKDIYFIVDYIRLSLMADSSSPTEDELQAVEHFFEQNPELYQSDKAVRELIRACFYSNDNERAKKYYTPCLTQAWLSDKTFQRIVVGVAKHSLSDASKIYEAKTGFGKQSNKPHYVLDFHRRLFTSHGTEEYGAAKPHYIVFQLWHLFSSLRQRNFNRNDIIKIELITGKGKKYALKTAVSEFVKRTFGWKCKANKSNSGMLEISGPAINIVRSEIKIPDYIPRENPFKEEKKPTL